MTIELTGNENKDSVEEIDDEKLDIIPIIIRRWKKSPYSLIIFFPEDLADFSGNIQSFEWIGQHGGANYNHCLKATKSVDYESAEVKDLLEKYISYYDYKDGQLKLYKRNNFVPTL